MVANPGQEAPDNAAIRELRDSVKDLNATIKSEIKSTKRFSLAFAGLAMVQIVIAIGEFGVGVIPSEQFWPRIALFIGTMALANVAFFKFLKDE